jgi:predicted DNA-binding antitoxin AbrB/MazE fold protein
MSSTTTIDAVYQGGVFRPSTPPDLPDGAAVRLTVVTAPVEQGPLQLDSAAVVERIQAIVAKARVTGRVETTARDHDQILYGSPEGA